MNYKVVDLVDIYNFNIVLSIWDHLNILNFKMWELQAELLELKLTEMKKVWNTKLFLIKSYDFSFSHFSIQGHLGISNFKMTIFKQNFRL